MSEHSFRIMTYNIHHAAGNDECEDTETPIGEIPAPDCSLDLPRIADVIDAEEVDIVALQEVDRFWARSGGVDQPEELASLLNMEFCYGANLTHEPDEHAEVQHEYGVVTLSRYPILSCEKHSLPITEGWEQRGMLDTRISVPCIGEMVVLNTHMQSNANGDAEEAARQRIEQALAIANYVATVGVPVIVLGDLNTEAASGEIDALIGTESILQDVWAIAGEGTGETIFDGAHGESAARIDHILVSPHFRVVSAEVIDNKTSRIASDHLPLIAELMFIDQIGTSDATPIVN